MKIADILDEKSVRKMSRVTARAAASAPKAQQTASQVQNPPQPAPQTTPPAQAQQPAAILVGTEMLGPDNLVYQFQGQQWVQKPGQPGGRGQVASRSIGAQLTAQSKTAPTRKPGLIRTADVKVRRAARKISRAVNNTPAGAAAGAAIGGAAGGIAKGLAQAAQGAGDPMGLGGYQDYTKNANQ